MNTEWKPMLRLLRSMRKFNPGSFFILRALVHELAVERRRTKHMTKLARRQSGALYEAAKELCLYQAKIK